MVVKYKTDTFYVKEKIENQTFYMEFSNFDDNGETIYINICVALYNKRKHAAANEDHKKLTGKNPFQTIAVGLKAYDMLEKETLDFYNRHYNVCLLVYWIDNRRRDAYHRILSKKGYQFGNMFGSKCLYKMVPKGAYKGE